ncbi:hypothetical protein H8706_11635 [Oscillospiraceae bacterium NSJ-50]|uniref:Uncharacterized protein n=2 Tax=Qingrenia yutianensis TaxID=2763676 RepID=A0A926IV27_9FIRM|nr:hypothetical protein [Qingrenia yutianensis]
MDKMEQKEIRFIDSRYNELFRIKDGESITVKFSDGSMSDRKCTYIDDYHTKIGYNVFHICEFAELMERGGSTYRPKGTPEYDKQTMIDLNFVKQNYDAINKDKFYKTTNGVMEMYYNPDANAGGQLVELTISKDDILEAAKLYNKPQDFFSHIGEMSKGVLYDVGTETFMETAKDFIESKADFEGCSLKTMNALKKYAAPEKSKTDKEPER